MASVRARTVFSDHKLVVTAVESAELRTGGSIPMRFLIGSLRPIAVIVRDSDRTRAYDMRGETVDIDRLNLPADFNLE